MSGPDADGCMAFIPPKSRGPKAKACPHCGSTMKGGSCPTCDRKGGKMPMKGKMPFRMGK